MAARRTAYHRRKTIWAKTNSSWSRQQFGENGKISPAEIVSSAMAGSWWDARLVYSILPWSWSSGQWPYFSVSSKPNIWFDINGNAIFAETLILYSAPYLAENLSIVVPIVAGVLTLFVLGCLLRTSCCDPGIIPRATPAEAAETEKQISMRKYLTLFAFGSFAAVFLTYFCFS